MPVSALATLLSYNELKRVFPGLTRVLKKSPPLRAFVQNSLPSMALIGFNALLPYALEFLCYAQGFQARSWVEHSLLKKCVACLPSVACRARGLTPQSPAGTSCFCSSRSSLSGTSPRRTGP